MSSDAGPNTKEFGRTFDTVSVVMLYDATQAIKVGIGPEDIDALEEKMGGPVRANQALDAALSLSVPRYQLELAALPGRFEVKSQSPDFSREIAKRMVTFLTLVAGQLGISPWRSIGHNFIVSLNSPREPAVKYIGRKLLKQGLSRKLSQEVIGGSADLWMEVDESTLLLRFHPTRSSITTRRFSANANFSVSIPDQDSPTESTTVDRMVKYCRRLDSILKGLDL